MIQVTIIKDKSSIMKKIYPRYHMYFFYKNSKGFEEKVHILSAQKKKLNKSSHYYISTEEKGFKKKNTGIIGKLKSNFTGTQFSLYNEKLKPTNKNIKKLPKEELRSELGFISYKKNILGLKGPRKMLMIFPKFEKIEYKKFQPMNVF